MRHLQSITVALVVLAAAPASAQQSTSFEVEQSTFNSGGHPDAGGTLGSTSFQHTFGAIGAAVAGLAQTSASFRVDGGLVASYPPPGEVVNVRFTDPSTLVWDPERSAGVYNLYLGDVTDPWGPSYGSCLQSGLSLETATVTDTPATGQALFILVTAENVLSEEGTKGTDNVGATRPNPAPCP